jgi:predicted porin
MKKHLLALAALAAVSGVAAAQSATVYGILDLSIVNQTNQSSAAKTKTGLNDAVWMPSVFGVTGSEDLGGGLKATFNLESDVNVDSGSLSQASAPAYSATKTTLFGRKANVGLTGSLGTITAGKDIDMLFLQGFIDNIRNSHSASAFVANAIGNNNSFSYDAVFIQNMVRYTTPSYNGFKASLQHKFGEQAGNFGKNSSTAGLLNYSTGGLNLNYGYKVVDGRQAIGSDTITGSDQKMTYVGANYTFDKFKVATTYHHTTNNGVDAVADTDVYELGVSYAISPALTAAVNYVKFETDTANSGSKNYSASLKYALSKRTNVWGLYSNVKQDSAAGSNVVRAVYSNLDTPAGKSTTAVALGITHSF